MSFLTILRHLAHKWLLAERVPLGSTSRSWSVLTRISTRDSIQFRTCDSTTSALLLPVKMCNLVKTWWKIDQDGSRECKSHQEQKRKNSFKRSPLVFLLPQLSVPMKLCGLVNTWWKIDQECSRECYSHGANNAPEWKNETTFWKHERNHRPCSSKSSSNILSFYLES